MDKIPNTSQKSVKHPEMMTSLVLYFNNTLFIQRKVRLLKSKFLHSIAHGKECEVSADSASADSADSVADSKLLE